MTDTPESSPKEKKAKKPKVAALSVVEKTSLNTLLERMNDEYSVILRGSQVFIMRHWIGEDKKSKLIFLSKRDFLIYQENNKLITANAEGDKSSINIAPAWLQWFNRKTYEEVYFEPCGKVSTKRYNLWQDFAFKPKEGAKFDLFLAHIKNNICQGNEEYYIWVMSWLADMFQNPSQKPGTALILRGGMGVGKGIFGHHIGKLFGIHYMSITQPSQLTGKFNGHMMDKILMFVDEGWWSDERNGVGTLNALITEPEIAVEMKGKDAIYIPNFTRFIFSANADRIVQTGLKDERRMTILDIGDHSQQDKAYFIAINEQLTNLIDGTQKLKDKSISANSGYAALLHYFLNYKYDKLLPRTILQTQALADHRLHSMSDEMKWWQHCLFREEICEAYKLNDEIPTDNDIECDKFFDEYLSYCNNMKIKPLPLNILPKRLKPFLDLNKEQKIVHTGRKWFYRLQAISDLKRKFEQALGNKVDWNEA